MAAEGMQFSWRWNGGTISLNLGVIWEMSVNHVVEGGPHKTKEELIAELESLPQRVGDLEQMVEGRENEDVPSEPFGDLNRIFREAPIGLCCLDTDLRFVQINDWMAAINGLSIEDQLPRRYPLIPRPGEGLPPGLRCNGCGAVHQAAPKPGCVHCPMAGEVIPCALMTRVRAQNSLSFPAHRLPWSAECK